MYYEVSPYVCIFLIGLNQSFANCLLLALKYISSGQPLFIATLSDFNKVSECIWNLAQYGMDWSRPALLGNVS